MLSVHGFTLSSRVIAINGVLFVLGTAVLAFSPVTVSARTLWSEVVVLVVGLTVMIVANAVLVGATLRPLDRLVGELDLARSTDPVERLLVPDAGISRTLAVSINDLLERIETGQRDNSLAALAAQESERSRIAQELHDGVGQSLTAVLLELGALSGHRAAGTAAETADAIDRAREMTRAALDEVRGVARQLRPHVLEDLGLRSALAALSTELFAHSSTHVRRGIMPGLPELDDAVELVVFRVAQEALTNVARHSRAKTVAVRLGQRGSRVVLTIEDDGIGFPLGATGAGIRGMQERASLVGGELRISRCDGGGTLVRLEVPM